MEGLGREGISGLSDIFPEPWLCLSDVSAVQGCGPRRRGGGRAGRADQRHPAQGHQPLPGRGGQRCPLTRVSTGVGLAPGHSLGTWGWHQGTARAQGTAHHWHKPAGTSFWGGKDVRPVSRALLKLCWQWK